MTPALSEFGYTAWGADIVRLAEPLSTRRPNPLLPRARSIARNGGVLLEIDGRVVRSTIHRGSEASVTHIEFTPMTPRVAAVLRGLIRSGSAADDDVHRAAGAGGAPPAPSINAVDCSCRARTDLCVHVLATLYALASEVDANPQLAVELQDYRRPRVDIDVVADGHPPRWVPLTAIDRRGYWS